MYSSVLNSSSAVNANSGSSLTLEIKSSDIFPLLSPFEFIALTADTRFISKSLYNSSKKSSSAFEFFGSELLATNIAPFRAILSTKWASSICSLSEKPFSL